MVQDSLGLGIRPTSLPEPLLHALRPSTRYPQVCGALNSYSGADGCGDLPGECAAGVAESLVEDCILVRPLKRCTLFAPPEEVVQRGRSALKPTLGGTGV